MVQLKKRWNEKRRRRRIRLDFPVKAGVVRAPLPFLPLHPSYAGCLQDASTEGLRVALDGNVSVGERLKFWINAWKREGRRQVVVRGDVLWVSPSEDGGGCIIGVQLHKHPRRGMKLWWEIVTTHLTMRGGVGAAR